MNEMESKLRAVDVDVDGARLSELAFTTLKRHHKDEAVSLRHFMRAVREDPGLLVALVTEPQLLLIAERYLRARSADMQGPSPGRSQARVASQVESERARAPSSSGRASQVCNDRQSSFDGASARPTKEAALSQAKIASLRARDQRRAPSPTTIPKASALRHTSIYDERIAERFDIRWGDITQHDYLNLKIKNAFSTEIAARLERVPWPDMTTPLRNILSVDSVQAIRDAAHAARTRALAAVKQVTHAQ